MLAPSLQKLNSMLMRSSTNPTLCNSGIINSASYMYRGLSLLVAPDALGPLRLNQYSTHVSGVAAMLKTLDVDICNLLHVGPNPPASRPMPPTTMVEWRNILQQLTNVKTLRLRQVNVRGFVDVRQHLFTLFADLCMPKVERLELFHWFVLYRTLSDTRVPTAA